MSLTDTPADPKAVAARTFAWVLAGGEPAADDPLPAALAAAANDGRLTDGERLAIWCYAHLAALLEPAAAARVGALRPALRVPPAFVARVRERASAFVAQLNPRPAAAALLARPPEDVLRLVTELVVEGARAARPPRRKLTGLSAVAYQHPMDRFFLSALAAIPGLGDAIVRMQEEHVRAHELRLLGNGIHVTPNSLPGLYACYRDAADALDVADPPPLYIEQGGLNAYTTGDHRPIVVVSPALADVLDRNELMFVLGHELGHVLCGHGRYRALARFLLEQAGGGLSLLKLGGAIAGNALVRTFYAWHRRSEFTADRAGYLACQNREAALRVMTKLIGFPLQAYDQIRTRSILDQGAHYRKVLDESLADRLLEMESSMALTHPLSVIRASELAEWIDDGGAAELIEGTPADRAAIARRAAQDPRQQALVTTACHALARWAAAEFRLPRAEAGVAVRRLVYEKARPAGHPVERVLRLELHVRQATADGLEYRLMALVQRGGAAAVVPIPVPYPAGWEEAPKDLRERFIGGAPEVVHLLFSV